MLRLYPEPISKQHFAEEAWNDLEMSDESLARCISQLRRLIPIDAAVSIRSVYGFGYKLVEPDGPRSSGLRHEALARIAEAPPAWAETVLHARHLLDSRESDAVNRSVALLEDLLVVAPRYVPARILLGEALAWQAYAGARPSAEALACAEAHLAVAERLGPASPGLNATLGHVLDLAWRFREAAIRHARALREFPHESASHIAHAVHLQMTGRPKAAAEAMSRGNDLRPGSIGTAITHSHLLLAAGYSKAALTRIERATRDFPGNAAVLSHAQSIRSYVLAEYHQDAATIHERALTSYPFAVANLSLALARQQAKESFTRLIDQTFRDDRSGAAARIVPALLALDLNDAALAELERALEARAAFLPAVLWAQQFAPIREHRRFQALWRRILSDR